MRKFLVCAIVVILVVTSFVVGVKIGARVERSFWVDAWGVEFVR